MGTGTISEKGVGSGASPHFPGDEAPGTWSRFSLADCDFFLLDARTYRESGGRAERRFLGKEEEAWLKEGLVASTAAFKFIVCGSPWNNQPKTGGPLTSENYYGNFGDTLASFKGQRDQLLNFIVEKRIGGVILVSGDRHRAEVVTVWSKERPEAVFYDLSNCNIASRTMAAAGPVGRDGLLYCFSGHCFGVLDIDTTAKPATVTYSIWGRAKKRDPVVKHYEFALEATEFLPRPAVPRPG